MCCNCTMNVSVNVWTEYQYQASAICICVEELCEMNLNSQRLEGGEVSPRESGVVNKVYTYASFFYHRARKAPLSP